MILSFATQLNGKPTHFVEKIQKGFRDYKFNMFGLDPSVHYPEDYNFYVKDKCSPKLHTIRKDEKNRWKKGVLIDFFINARQKNMFRFAPRVPVVSTQTIYMTYAFDNIIEITIGGKYIYDFKEKEQLAINDGFDSYKEFFDYFYPIIKSSENEFYKGKIIHWTDLRY